MGYGFKIGGSSFYRKAVKPTFSGSYTFDTTNKNVVINGGEGYDSSAFTIIGTTKSANAGTYTVYARLNKGYKWSDGSFDDVQGTWTISRRQIQIPSLNPTQVSYIGVTVRTNVNGYDATYMKQTGNDSYNGLSNSIGVNWSLRYPNDTYWSDDTNTTKTKYWSTVAGQISYTVRVQHETKYSQSTQACYYGQTFNDVCPVDLSANRIGGGSSSVAQFLKIKNLVCESRGVAINFDWTDWYADGHNGYMVRSDLPTTTQIKNGETYLFSPNLS